MRPEDVARIAKECADELTEGKWVQSAQALMTRAPQETGAGVLLGRLLARLEAG
jgi:hypothetical protein